MSRWLIAGLAVALAAAPVLTNAQNERDPTKGPPVAAPLVREGDFAVMLAQALRITKTQDEAEAVNMLASVGIEPKNGWIADYPVTPEVMGELWNNISGATRSGQLSMGEEEARRALQQVAEQLGLSLQPDMERAYGETEPPPPLDYGQHTDPSLIERYYYEQGPPVVSYYPPPPDYYYLYSWVPSPFWCSGVWFGGFFILRDFHKVVIVRDRRKVVSNKFFDPKEGKFRFVHSSSQGDGRGSKRDLHGSGKALRSAEESKDGGAILRRSLEKLSPGRNRWSGGQSAGFQNPVLRGNHPPGPQRNSMGSSVLGRDLDSEARNKPGRPSPGSGQFSGELRGGGKQAFRPFGMVRSGLREGESPGMGLTGRGRNEPNFGRSLGTSGSHSPSRFPSGPSSFSRGSGGAFSRGSHGGFSGGGAPGGFSGGFRQGGGAGGGRGGRGR